jgi:hypothetical protein
VEDAIAQIHRLREAMSQDAACLTPIASERVVSA